MNYKLEKYFEHFEGKIELPIDCVIHNALLSAIFFKKKESQHCYLISLNKETNDAVINTTYFVGVDWVVENKLAIYVAPKLNTKRDIVTDATASELISVKQTDYVRMLFDCLKHAEVSKVINELFEIKWDKPEISIEQKNDLLTPLLVIQFLVLVKEIVRKGLKKSYYKRTDNLYGKVKGKIKVSETIKQNKVKNKNLHTICSFDIFGFDGLENRLIKKALLFAKRYLPVYVNMGSNALIKDLLDYIMPAFADVSTEVKVEEIRYMKHSVFYKHYAEVIHLANLILSRYGYNISNIEKQFISTPPFWIDMSKLFELYILGLLKDRFGSQVHYHFTHYGNELDFILKADGLKVVIDSKYKPKYNTQKEDKDIRQISGYARLEKVYSYLEKVYPESIDCLIIYPDQDKGLESLMDVDLLSNKIQHYHGVYKIGVKIPIIK